MSVFNNVNFDHHEQVVFCHEPETGLKAIIAIHSTKLGPAAGGCRMYPYKSIEDAVSDVLRLSRGMSYKNALAGLPLGGGKSVIIGDPYTQKSKALLKAFAEKVHSLNGQYYTAEDIGMEVEDVLFMSKHCDFTFGFPTYDTPFEFTALGVFMGMKAAVKHRLNKSSLEGLTVSVQGVGHVGAILCRLIHQEGAKLKISDVNQQSLDKMTEAYAAVQVPLEEIYSTQADVFAPCAIGAILNDNTIPQLKASVIAGAANNQLLESKHGMMLKERNILYAPDYLVNSGGMIAASDDILEVNDSEDAYRRVRNLYEKHLELFEEADKLGLPPSDLADTKTRVLLGLEDLIAG